MCVLRFSNMIENSEKIFSDILSLCVRIQYVLCLSAQKQRIRRWVRAGPPVLLPGEKNRGGNMGCGRVARIQRMSNYKFMRERKASIRRSENAFIALLHAP